MTSDRETEPTRRLVHIPIVHSQTDMGSSSEDVRAAYIDQKGPAAWEASRQAIAGFWRDLEAELQSLELDFDRVRLYQDGLPVCGHESRIVRDLARAGGANYRILLGLMSRGATLEGTEDPELLLREYQLIKTGFLAEGSEADWDASNVAASLLEQRDRFIARRIDATLKPGETGILFLGALHRAVDMLPKSIEVCATES